MKVENKRNTGFDENNTEHETLPRRQSARRTTSRRKSKPLFAPIEKIKILRKQDEHLLTPIRIADRRLKDRRQSRVSLLSTEEIKLLRKK